jgi:hypothetical protein
MGTLVLKTYDLQLCNGPIAKHAPTSTGGIVKPITIDRYMRHGPASPHDLPARAATCPICTIAEATRPAHTSFPLKARYIVNVQTASIVELLGSNS